jgi:alkane 1-monooxygenase
MQFAATVMGLQLAVDASLGWLGWLGLLATIGIVSGAGINVAHELGHRRGRLGPWLAKLALAPALYGHFQVEHNRGHHVRVATPEDPASARLGESYWRFLPRTMLGSLRSAWRLESDRLGKSGLGWLHWRNEVLQAWALSALWLVATGLVFGPLGLLFFIGQAFYGAALLETVNYIEHYGLLRQRDPNGRYLRCAPEHSWNSNHLVSNLLLFQLQRHSDHHAHPTRPYQALRHFDDAPQLPAGYAALVPAACIPPLWFWLMDQRVLAHYGGDRSRCNLGPDAGLLGSAGAVQGWPE